MVYTFIIYTRARKSPHRKRGGGYGGSAECAEEILLKERYYFSSARYLMVRTIWLV